MAEQLQRAQELTEHSMPWPVQNLDDAATWLGGLQCQQDGLVQRCWQQHSDSIHQQHTASCGEEEEQASADNALAHAWLPVDEQQWQQAWGLPDHSLIPAWSQGGPELQQLEPAAGWRQYYDLRQLPHPSPAALVLHHVLTLWHCLISLLPQHGWHLPPPGQTLHVAYLGAKAELALLPAFAELALLLPHHRLDIHFVGPDVPEHLHQHTCRGGPMQSGPQQQGPKSSLQVSCWASCFHDALADWAHARSSAQGSSACPANSTDGRQWVPAAAPAAEDFHLVFCANAGLPAYASWLPTLRELVRMAPASDGRVAEAASTKAAARGVPAVFSDYCEEAACMSEQVAQQVLGRAFSLCCCLNPFRDPVPAAVHGTRLPACKNGFLFGWV